MNVNFNQFDGEKLQFFKDLYEEARAASETDLENMEKYLAQYKGTTEIDGSSVPASIVRNLTYELVESQIAGYIPNPVVTPKMWSEKNERNAKAIETMLRNLRDELPFEKCNDLDERYNPIYGGSVWLTEWDESIASPTTVGEIRVSCLSPKHFVGQPNIYEIDDMEYCFVKFETTKEDIMRRFNVSLEVVEDAESDESADDKTATLYICYYKNDDDKVCQYIWSGDTEILDLDDIYARKRTVCKTCGQPKALCTCERDGNKPKYETVSEEFEILERDIPLSDGSVLPAMSEVIKDGQVVTETQKQQAIDEMGNPIFDDSTGVMLPVMIDVEVPKLEPTKIPFYHPKTFPITIRKNTSEEDSLFGQSDCEFIRPQQQAINKIESRIMEKLMGGGVYPIIPDDANVDLDNSIFKKVFRAKPSNYNLYGRVDLQVDVSRDIAASERLYDHAKRILGITDSFQGQADSTAASGRAKQLQIQQAAGRLDSKRRMKNAAYAEIDKAMFTLRLAFSDEPRPATYKDAEGHMQNIIFSRYDFIERNLAGEYYYNDAYLFSADSSMDEERSREILWQENRQNFQSGAYGDPALPQTQLIFWQNMEKAHYPWAKDNVERIRAEIQRQHELEMMQQQIAERDAEIENRANYENYLINTMGGKR